MTQEQKQLRRPHFIKEWMDKASVTAAELSEATGVDKSLISRYLNHGGSPSVPSQEKLGKFFGCGRDGLFCHPDEWWMREIVKQCDSEEIEQLKRIIRAAVPKKVEAARLARGG